MKIEKIYINAFGALENFSLEFSDGFQVIYGENEAGKTTVTEFIKAMFYGMPRRAAGQAISAREKYTPWGGAPAGGRVYFEHSGRKFCLEKQFRKSDATDKATITDTASGKSEVCPADIGKQLFGISLAAFERSVFIGNTPEFSRDNGALSEINQKLSSAALGGGDGVSHQKVLNRIDDARLKLISKSGKVGSQITDINNCNALISALDETDTAARKKQNILKEIAATDGRIKDLQADINGVQKVLDSAKDIENAQKLKEYCDLKDSLDNVTREITLPDGTVADEMFLKKFEFGFSKLRNMEEKIGNEKEQLRMLRAAAAERSDASPEQIKEKISLAQAEKTELEKQETELNQKISALETEAVDLKEKVSLSKTAKKAVNPVLFISGTVAALFGIGLYFPLKNLLVSGVIIAAGAVLAALGFIFRPVNHAAAENARIKSESKNAELTAARAQLTVLKGELNNLDLKIQNLNVSLNFGINDEQRIKETEGKIEADMNAFETEREKVLKFFNLPVDTDIAELAQKVNALGEKAAAQKQIKLHLSYLSRDLGNISYEQAREKSAQIKGEDISFDIEEQKRKLQSLSDEKTAAVTLKTRLETELKTAFRGMRDPEDLRREIKLLKERIAAKQAFYDAAGTAYDVLSESLIEARKTFGSALEKETLKNLKAITGGAYGMVNISSDFDISAEKSDVFGTHEAEYLSRGTKDQIYLSLRLAVSKLITDREPLPIILDDALSQYDDGRFSAALKFLSEYSLDTQILLFTCHNYVCAAAKDAGISTVNLA